MAPSQHYSYRPSPQLSANQMAEYLTASPTRRKSIIRAARFPGTVVVAQYEKAREGLANFVGDLNRSVNHLTKVYDYLDRRGARFDATEWTKRDGRLSKEAIEAFQRGYNKMKITKLDCRAVHGRQPPIDIWPTKISVALDLTAHQRVANAPDRVGGVIFLFSRGEQADAKRAQKCKTIAGLAHTYVERFLTGMGEPDVSLCFAIDVFAGTPYSPPGSFVRQLRHIADACEEIAERWKTVPPPDDYDGPDFS